MKAALIKQVKSLIDPAIPFALFQDIGKNQYLFRGEKMNRAQCNRVKAQLKIFYKRTIVKINQ